MPVGSMTLRTANVRAYVALPTRRCSNVHYRIRPRVAALGKAARSWDVAQQYTEDTAQPRNYSSRILVAVVPLYRA
jgi:hypothetical protein